ncbi:diacylglycerol kinase family protein [Streptomyces echinatus]|uniref:diacylglycerol kinase family protein n=1 Tax=Streptomyces echinatus TaxID=67293 RepID=UPI003556014F
MARRRRHPGACRRGGRGDGLPFVVVPAGTRNHFARDLGLNREDPSSALEAL